MLLTNAPNFVWEIRHQANASLHHPKAILAVLECKSAHKLVHFIVFLCLT
ncbi:hypothetical protein PEC301879_12670 [Pectobacterium carotovorum subsp. carotovorum]|nr:hypothetical protein PEC301879_12670 [Pectobacterium carotovorum subsp. carotovorum]